MLLLSLLPEPEAPRSLRNTDIIAFLSGACPEACNNESVRVVILSEARVESATEDSVVSELASDRTLPRRCFRLGSRFEAVGRFH